MDPQLINKTSFSAAKPSSYTITDIWPLPGISGEAGHGSVLGLRMGKLGGGFGELAGSVEESTVAEHSGGRGNGRKRRDLSSEDASSKMVSTTSSGNELDDDSNGKRMKVSGSKNENSNSRAEIEAGSTANKHAEQSSKLSEPPKDYIHVKARRGQATDSHSLAERARREKISERMKILQDLVPGCHKVIGKALVLDEIINYIQSLQHQVELLSMKLEAINSRMNVNPTFEAFHPKDLSAQPFDATGMVYGSQATIEYAQGPEPKWLHMQVGGSFGRAS